MESHGRSRQRQRPEHRQCRSIGIGPAGAGVLPRYPGSQEEGAAMGLLSCSPCTRGSGAQLGTSMHPGAGDTAGDIHAPLGLGTWLGTPTNPQGFAPQPFAHCEQGKLRSPGRIGGSAPHLQCRARPQPHGRCLWGLPGMAARVQPGAGQPPRSPPSFPELPGGTFRICT